MPIFEETWDQEGTLLTHQDYNLRDRRRFEDIPENAVRLIASLPFKFRDYRVSADSSKGQRADRLLAVRARSIRVQKRVRRHRRIECKRMRGKCRLMTRSSISGWTSASTNITTTTRSRCTSLRSSTDTDSADRFQMLGKCLIFKLIICL